MKIKVLPFITVCFCFLIGCGEETSVASKTSSEAFVDFTVAVDKANNLLVYTEANKGVCLGNNKSVTWNTDTYAKYYGFQYNISNDTLYLFSRSLDSNITRATGLVYTGNAKSIYGTWNFTGCNVIKQSDSLDKNCLNTENMSYTTTLKISSSNIIEDVLENENYNFSYSNFLHGIFLILEGEGDADSLIGQNLFYSNDANFEEFTEHADKFIVKNNKKAEFTYQNKRFEFNVDSNFVGYKTFGAVVSLVSKGDTCLYRYNEYAMQKKYCKSKFADEFSWQTYTDFDGEIHEAAKSYIDDNLTEFKKCVEKLSKEIEVKTTSAAAKRAQSAKTHNVITSVFDF